MRTRKEHSLVSVIWQVHWVALPLVLSLVACSVGHHVISHQRVSQKIQGEAFDDLRKGNLLAIRDRYEQRGAGNLNGNELAILCDIYIKHLSISKALDCLDTLQAGLALDKASERIKGKKALIAYLLGHYRRAVELTSNLKDDGARYVHALAQTRLSNKRAALDTARRWALAYDPEHDYLAANLYLASGRYENALAVLQDPERRVAWDYSLTGGRTVFGKKIRPAPLKIDLFDEFGFGLLDTYSYAPAANVYVEFILAKSELELGNQAEARRRFDTILSYPNIGAFREIYWRALYERARIAEMDGHPTEAISLYKQAIELIESVRSSISTEAGRIGFVGNKQEVYAKLIQLLLARGDIRTAFEYTERARSRALVDVLATQRRFGGRAAVRLDTDSVLRDYERAESRVLELEGTGTSAELKRSFDSHLAERQRVLRLLPMLSGLVTVNSERAKLVNIQPQITPGETLLSYFKAGETWYVFVLTRSESHIKQLELPNLNQQISAFRSALASGAGNDARRVARGLYDRLIGPVVGTLSETLTIVPFGELHYLPFAALHSGRNFLVEKHTLRILPSAEVLTILQPRGRPRGSMLAFGNPSRDDLTPSLPGTEREARRVAKAHKPSKLLLGADASLANFHALASKYDILHVAAHGEFVPDAPLQSRLLLAPSKGDSGDLTVGDLYYMLPPLRSSVAVLSACETALAGVASGDDLIGLQRGFLFAGADSIIGSLWRISDETTVYLMEQFYTSLDRGTSRAKALREAQIKALGRYPDLGDWAAFTYTGAH